MQAIDLDKTIKAILQAQTYSQWKQGKASSHLTKRIRLGHLPKNATVDI